MKKLLGISIVAVLAVTPLMANAAVSVTLADSGSVTASNDVASTSYVKGAYNVLGEAINSLGTTVGDANSGLVKTVGDANSGLVKDVTDLKTTVGDSSAGLVKRVTDLESTGQHLTAGNGIDTTGNAITVKPTATGSGLSVTSAGVAVSGVTKDNIAANAGIEKTQLDSTVQASLGKADSALQASDIATLESTVSGHTTSIGALESTVGDNTSGLVHDVAALDAAINDQTTGLGKQVSDNTTAIGTNATSITNITNGTTTVGKAEKDAAGNVITTTYATKSELAAKRVAVNTTWGNDSLKGEVALVEQGSTSGSGS